MKKLIAVMVVGFFAVVCAIPAFATDGCTPWLKAKKNITDTPSIKAMQGQKCRGLEKRQDVLDNWVPTQSVAAGNIDLNK